jgi:hypothetical protein
MKNWLGFIYYKELPKRLNLEIQLFAFIRSFKDGITFFEININFDRWKSEHTPSFQFELTIFNMYNHIWVYQNNFDEVE